MMAGPPPVVSDNWPDTGRMPGPERGLTWSGGPVRSSDDRRHPNRWQVGRHGVAVVNGPEDDNGDWRSVHWAQVEADVRRLRQRIFTASKAGDLKRVRSLQKLMLRSRANVVVSVRRVTDQRWPQDGRGRRRGRGDRPGKAALGDWCPTTAVRGRRGPSSGCTYAKPTGSSARWGYR